MSQSVAQPESSRCVETKKLVDGRAEASAVEMHFPVRDLHLGARSSPLGRDC